MVNSTKTVKQQKMDKQAVDVHVEYVKHLLAEGIDNLPWQSAKAAGQYAERFTDSESWAGLEQASNTQPGVADARKRMGRRIF